MYECYEDSTGVKIYDTITGKKFTCCCPKKKTSSKCFFCDHFPIMIACVKGRCHSCKEVDTQEDIAKCYNLK